MDETNEAILANFYNVCGLILMGKATEEEIKAATRAMIDSGQQDIMAKEFHRMGTALS